MRDKTEKCENSGPTESPGIAIPVRPDRVRSVFTCLVSSFCRSILDPRPPGWQLQHGGTKVTHQVENVNTGLGGGANAAVSQVQTIA